MTFGWFTPTEAAIAACAWAMILGIFLYRTLSLKQFYKVTMDTIETTAGVLLIVGAASLFGWVLTTTRVTEYTTEALLVVTDNRYIILLLQTFCCWSSAASSSRSRRSASWCRC